MPLEVEGPDGQIFEFPDDTDRETIKGVLARKYLDFNRPVAEVRKDISKIRGKQHDLALQDWARVFVKREGEEGGIGRSIDNAVRTVARGTFAGPFLDEATAATQGILHKVTGGAAGSPYDEAVAYQRARDEQFDTENPVLSLTGQLAGGVAGFGAGRKAIQAGGIANKAVGTLVGGPLAGSELAKTFPGRMAQGFGTGALYGGTHGFGTSEGGVEDRVPGAGQGAVVGSIVGSVLPPVVEGGAWLAGKAAEAASPVTVRIAQNLHNLRDRLAIKASGGVSFGPQTGDEAAADQIIANQLSRAGVTTEQLRQRLAQADEASLFGGGTDVSQGASRAVNATALVDTDPSLQRLASSVARQSPEAGNIGASFQYARQTGQPSGLPEPASFNLTTRPPLAKPRASDQPAGQFERLRDGLRRALRIEDSYSHGHGRNAFETERLFLSKARAAANENYGKTYKAAEGLDIRPTILPVIQKWAAEAADQPEGVAKAIKKFLRQFATENGTVASLQRFQKAKEFGDQEIKRLMRKNRYVGGVLSNIQKDLLAAVDGISHNGVGALYKAARDNFSGAAVVRDALNMGREALKENSEVAVDHFRQLATEGERKAFRLGLWDSFGQATAGRKRTDDVTQIFQSPRVQELLGEVIPRSKEGGTAFANRPERFGQFVQNEQKFIQTRNETLGNSKTPLRLSDDEALNSMQQLIESAQKAGKARTLTEIALQVIEGTLNKLFGLRADTAASIARRLYSADPAQQRLALAYIERRLGPSRAEHFQQLLSQYERLIVSPTAGAAGGQAGGQ